MTDRVENNLFKPNLPADNNATNNPPKTVGLGDSLMAAGQLLAGAGVRDSVVRAAYNNAGGCFGFGFGVGGNFFPVPGLDATDIWARTNLANLFNDVCNIYKGCGNISGTNTNGVTSDATAAEKTKNPADPFSKLDYEQVKEMAAKEQEIADKEKALQEEKDKKDAGDKERIKTLSKELYDLRKEYEKKDKELGGGSELSKSFGGKGKFYKNISEEEFTQIQDINKEIQALKDELQKLEDEGSKLAAEYTKVQQQLVSAGKASDNQSVLNAMSESSRERFAKVKDEREAKISEIESKAKELKSFIEKAGKDDNSADFYTHIEEKAVNDKAAAKKAAGNNISKTIADKMHNADGTLKTKEDIKSEIAAIGEKGKFSDTEIEAVLNRIYAVAEGKNKEELKAALGDKKFFNDIYATQGLLNNPKELLLLQKTYDSLVGAGKFNENGKKYLENVNGQPYWKNVIAAIKKGQKEIDAPIAPAKGAQTPAKTESQPAKTESASDEDSPKTIAGISSRNSSLIINGLEKNENNTITHNGMEITSANIKNGSLNVGDLSPVEIVAILKSGQVKLTDFNHGDENESKYIGQILKRLNSFGEDLGEKTLLHRNFECFTAHELVYSNNNDYTLIDTIDDVGVGKCTPKTYNAVNSFVERLYNVINEKRKSVGLSDIEI